MSLHKIKPKSNNINKHLLGIELSSAHRGNAKLKRKPFSIEKNIAKIVTKEKNATIVASIPS